MKKDDIILKIAVSLMTIICVGLFLWGFLSVIAIEAYWGI